MKLYPIGSRFGPGPNRCISYMAWIIRSTTMHHIWDKQYIIISQAPNPPPLSHPHSMLGV